ncbi:MAG: hypothetical protein JOZ42_17460 [Acetobacteraceae bacterium]|nr:hypothetical protein [Acetobacteraceae bacterium]
MAVILKPTRALAIVFVMLPVILVTWAGLCWDLRLPHGFLSMMCAGLTALFAAFLWLEAALSSEDRTLSAAAAAYSAAAAFFAAGAVPFPEGWEQMAFEWCLFISAPAVVIISVAAGAGMARLTRWKD